LSNTLTGARTWTGDLLVSGGRFAVRGGTANAATSLTVRDCTIDNTLSANAQLIVDISTGTTVVTVGLTTNRDFKIILTQNSNYANLVQYRGVSMTENITVGGNFTQTGNFTGQIRENAATSGTQNFIFQNGTNSVYSADRADIFGPITTINITSATVDFGNSILTYTGNFALTNATAHAKFGGSGYLNNTGTFSANVAGNTLTIGSQDGITTTGGLTGNIRSSAGRTYNAGTNLIYVGSTGQITGNAQPAASTGYIMVNLSDAGALTFTNPTLSGNGVNVRMVSGSLANAITYTNATNSILTYEGIAAQTTTDNEFPATTGPRSLVINNPNGVTLHASRSTNSGATNFFTLTSGVLNTTTANVLTVLNPVVGGVVGGDATSYVNGPLIRAINAAGTYNFPVGDGAAYGGYSMLTTAAASGVSLRVQFVNSASGGTAGVGMASTYNYHWLVERTAGSTGVTYTPTLSIGGLTASSRVGYSKTVTGAYDNTGAVNIGATITSAQQQTISTVDPNAYYTVGATGTLSGTQTSYLTLTAIANALLTMEVTGNTIFELPTSYSGEPAYPVVFAPFTEDGNGPYNIIIRPATGSTNFLTAGVPAGANVPLINLNGIDRVTFDGRAGGAGSSVWTFRNTQTTSAGTTFQFVNDATYNTLTYLTVEGQNVATSSTAGTILFGLAPSPLTLGNSNNTISYCHIKGRADNSATPAIGIYSLGTASITNNNNHIHHNEIYDYHGSATVQSGIFVSSNSSAWTIEDNHFYQTASRVNGTGSHYVININNTGSSFIVRNNFIGGSQSSAGGSAYTLTGTSGGTFNGIYFNPNTNATGCEIENNVIRNISFSRGTSVSAVAFIGIRNANGHTQIDNNTIGATTGTGSITLTDAFSTSGQNNISNGIVVDLGNTIVVDLGNTAVRNNAIGSITTAGASTAVAHSFYGILIASGIDTLENNIIGSETTANSINASNASTNSIGQFVVGIQHNSTSTGNHSITANKVVNLNNAVTAAAGNARGIATSTGTTGNLTIANNEIYNVAVNSANTGTGVSASNIGILMQRTTAGQTVSGNTIYGLSNGTASAIVHVSGIHFSGPTTGTNAVSGNFIHSLSLSSSNVGGSIIGINALAGLATRPRRVGYIS